LEGFVAAGDLKRQYNPIDVRVVIFWQNFIRRAMEQSLRVILVMGNHDRVGMYLDAQNWLPVLRESGAEIVHKSPKRIGVENGTLYCLPFNSNIETTKKWAKELAAERTGDAKAVLVFHNDLLRCSYNVLGHKSDGKLRIDDLRPDTYDLCLGGHVHLRQKLGENIHYIGNPFCTDWGEANQAKGYLILNGEKLTPVPSSIPGWYDPSWPRFPKEKRDWKDTRVRVHVPIELGKNYGLALQKARQEAEHKYAGAVITTVPEFQDTETPDVKLKLSDSDSIKVSTYVRQK